MAGNVTDLNAYAIRRDLAEAERLREAATVEEMKAIFQILPRDKKREFLRRITRT